MKRLKLLFFAAALSVAGLETAAQSSSEDDYVRVRVQTRGNSGLENIGDFEVVQGIYKVARTADGYYLCRRYGRRYALVPRRAEARWAGYFVVSSDCRISSSLGRRMYYKAGATERDMMFPIEIRPNASAPDGPIRIVVQCTSEDRR